jgi:acetoin utilization deacetylase AcuC-like enzyme
MNKIPVFFNQKMVVDIIFETPSPRKPLEVVNQWKEKYPIELMDFNPITVDDFYLAHKKEHVDGIIDLSIKNGMDTNDQEVVDSLYWTSGSMLAASRHALKYGVAVSPTSGFHHAGYDYSWGFCTFNGLIVTAQKLLKEDGVKKVGILDFDYHRGDGSEDIMEKLALSEPIVHLTGNTNYTRKKAKFFEEIPGLLEQLKGVDIILYQAGADQHEKDPLGGFLDDEQLRMRDSLVFLFAKTNNIPIAWNLAGGYQEENHHGFRSIQKVLNIHNATMEECIKLYVD